MQSRDLVSRLVSELDSHKALDIIALDVRDITSITDAVIICSGNSNRHAKSLADYVIKLAKEHDWDVLGVEGESPAEWVLVDLNEVVVHIMLENVRSFYNLEGLWMNADNVLHDIKGG